MSAQTLCLLTLCTNYAFKDNKDVWPVSFPHKSIKLIRLKKTPSTNSHIFKILSHKIKDSNVAFNHTAVAEVSL